MHTYIHTYTHIHTYIHKYIHTYIHVYDESCNIIKFGLGQDTHHVTEYNCNGHRYVVTDENLNKFDNNRSDCRNEDLTGHVNSTKLDRITSSQVKESKDTEIAVDLLQEVLISPCN